jgi:hypothetical protein
METAVMTDQQSDNAHDSEQQKEKLLFYTTLGCHLCDQARAVYRATLNPDFFVIEEVDIAEDDGLIEQYGTRIPVMVQQHTGRELGWPFNPEDLVDFLSEGQE